MRVRSILISCGIPALAALGWFSCQAWAGPVGPEFRVNSFRTGYQWNPSVAGMTDGGFVVTWGSERQDGSSFGVYGQRYDSAGNRVRKEFQVNTYTKSSQADPSVAGLSDGGFVVTWVSDGQDGSYSGVYGQRYDSAGNRIGMEFQVNTHTNNYQLNPSVAGLSDGGFVVTWMSIHQDGSHYGVYGQRYDSAGNRVGNEFQVNTYTTSDQEFPSVAGLSDGGFVVIWQSYLQDGSSFGVYGQRYDSAGNRVGKEFQVNAYTTSYQGVPSVAGLNDGGFVVTWDSESQDGSLSGVYGQRYDTVGNRVRKEFQVNTYTTEAQSFPSAARLSDGGFAVTWQSYGQDGDLRGVYGQRYDSAGNRVGKEFQVNTYTTSDQESPSVAGLSDGGFVVTWNSERQDGSSIGVYGQRYAP